MATPTGGRVEGSQEYGRTFQVREIGEYAAAATVAGDAYGRIIAGATGRIVFTKPHPPVIYEAPMRSYPPTIPGSENVIG